MNTASIKAIIGLGNPGPSFYNTRHNIGFLILDEIARAHNLSWQTKANMEIAQWAHNGHAILLIKPQTFMNDSGKIMPYLIKQGIRAENILVVHDELELPFGVIKTKLGGSAKGHNGLRSLIAAMGDNFLRLRFGIARPAQKEQVAAYVLQKFNEPSASLNTAIAAAVKTIESLLS